MTKLTAVIAEIKAGLIEVDFDIKSELQAVIVGNGLTHKGTIIDKKGKIVYEKEFGLENLVTPTCREFIESYISK